MKNMKRVLVLVVAFCAMMCITAFAADNTIKTIKDLGPNVTVSGYENSTNFTLVYSNATDGGYYLVVVLRNQTGVITEDDVLDIKQVTANGKTATFDGLDKIYPKEIEADESYIYLSGAGLSGLTHVGTIVPNAAAAANVTVTVIGKGANMPAYTVNGRNVTVTYSLPCKMGYLNADGTYTAIAATANGDGSYSYVVPEGINEVVVVVKGDATGDGLAKTNDCARINAAVLGKTTLSAEAVFASDVTGDGKMKTNDCARLNATVLGKTTLAW